MPWSFSRSSTSRGGGSVAAAAGMPSVDRTILRLATYELLWRDEVPAPVAIDEAVELAKSLSTDESPTFVNGVLARVLADRDQLLAEPGSQPL